MIPYLEPLNLHCFIFVITSYLMVSPIISYELISSLTLGTLLALHGAVFSVYKREAPVS